MTRNEAKWPFNSNSIWITTAALAGLILVSFKAWRAPITHDEALSILLWAPSSLKELWTMHSVHGFTPDANNHILNSWLIGWSQSFFGFHEVAHRLPNILAFGLYCAGMIGALKIITVNNKLLTLAFPFTFLFVGFLDFFSLARGYGMSFGFLSLALWMLLEYQLQNRNWKILLLGQIFALLAVLSNFTLLNFFAAQWGIAAIQNLQRDRSSQSERLVLGGTALVSICLLYYPLSLLMGSGAIYFGETDGLLRSTARSLILELSGRQGRIIPLLLAIIFSASAILYGFQLFRQIRNNSLNWSPINYLAGLLTSICLSLIVQRQILDVPYVIERAALYLWPIVLLFMIGTLLNQGVSKRIAQWSIITILIVFTLHFGRIWTPVTTLEWQYDANSPEVQKQLGISCSNNNGKSVTAGVSWIYVPSINYYKVKWKHECVDFVTRYEVTTDPDFLYLTSEDVAPAGARLKNYTTQIEFGDGARLYVRNKS